MIKNKILLKDVLKLAESIPDESVDCVIADFPYNIGKDFGNDSDNQSMKDYIEWTTKCNREFERVLKKTGTGFIYGFSEILEDIAVNLTLQHRWLIWHYTNKNSNIDTFWQRSHESIIAFWKNKNQRIFNADLVREPYTEKFINNAAGKVRKNTRGRYGDKSETIYTAHENGAMGRDVIKVATLAGGAGSTERIFACNTCGDVFIGDKKSHKDHDIIEHPTQKPQELTNKLLLSCLPIQFSANERPLVYIPFAGSGSECLCCINAGVDFISSDINEEYVNNANKIMEKYGDFHEDNSSLFYKLGYNTPSKKIRKDNNAQDNFISF